ncbi:DUF1501 domain-containing protein [Seohaeicola saemankumensis]|nr:DUF1501 domain-containing protein [Seohaeicola saemankumensis]MCA0871238.1 DUF1501 domain-containing protein [Seohaeicola saemankumensis]
MSDPISRRAFLARSALIGCSAAASPLWTPVSFAAAPWDTRLVVIILRGGMDALDVVQPYGDPDYQGLRTKLAGGPASGASDLDGFFALHPALSPLMPLWRKGELGFVHAVSTPYRNKRSHFDGQDLLEAGTDTLAVGGDGWLNRLLQQIPGVEARTAYAIGHDDMKLLSGAAPVANWSPDAELIMSPQAVRLTELVMQEDPMFHAALNEALLLSEPADIDAAAMVMAQDDGGSAMMQMTMPRPVKGKSEIKIAQFAAEQLRGDARVASFSINGWDTHNRQEANIKAALTRLSDTLLTLQEGLGDPIWQNTAIMAMTEFGRTARENGTGGTDHGTGGAMLLAGGAIRGGRVYGDWPGLSEAALFDRRDLMPTGDVRDVAAWIMHSATGLDQNRFEQVVFPGLSMSRKPGFLL